MCGKRTTNEPFREINKEVNVELVNCAFLCGGNRFDDRKKVRHRNLKKQIQEKCHKKEGTNWKIETKSKTKVKNELYNQ